MTRRLKRVLTVAKPLSKAQARAALKWLPKATVHEVAALRHERGGHLFLIVNSGESNETGSKNTTRS